MERADTKRSSIVIAVVMGILLVVSLFFMTANSKAEQNKTESESNQRALNVITTGNDVYYAKNNKYPRDMSELINSLGDTKEATKSAANMLDDFEYKVRGDNQAYQVTYSENGETKIVNREYRKDYQ